MRLLKARLTKTEILYGTMSCKVSLDCKKHGDKTYAFETQRVQALFMLLFFRCSSALSP